MALDRLDCMPLFEPDDPFRSTFHAKIFYRIVTNPSAPELVVAGEFGAPYYDYYPTPHLYVSRDGGQTFAIELSFESGSKTQTSTGSSSTRKGAVSSLWVASCAPLI